MSNIKELFIATINEGIKAAGMIPDAAQKAEAYASLANALARTGLVRTGETIETEVAPKEALKVESTKGKGKSKAKTAKKDEVVIVEEKEEVVIEVAPETSVAEETTPEVEITEEEVAEVEETAQETTQEEEIVDEWTDEMCVQFENEIAYIGQLKEEYDIDTLNECVSVYSEGAYNDLSEVSPLSIRGFIAYMESIIAEASEE